VYETQISITLVRLIVTNWIRDIFRLHISWHHCSFYSCELFLFTVISWLSVYTCCYYLVISYLLSVYVHTVYMHEHLPLFLTHWLGRYLTTLILHVQIGYFISLIRCSLSSYASRGAWSYPRLDHQYSCFFLFCWFLILYVSVLVIILFHFYVHWYHVWTSIYVIAVIMIYCNKFL